MKLSELIEELQQYNQDADVYVFSSQQWKLAIQTFDNEQWDHVFISWLTDEELVA